MREIAARTYRRSSARYGAAQALRSKVKTTGWEERYGNDIQRLHKFITAAALGYLREPAR